MSSRVNSTWSDQKKGWLQGTASWWVKQLQRLAQRSCYLKINCLEMCNQSQCVIKNNKILTRRVQYTLATSAILVVASASSLAAFSSLDRDSASDADSASIFSALISRAVDCKYSFINYLAKWLDHIWSQTGGRSLTWSAPLRNTLNFLKLFTDRAWTVAFDFLFDRPIFLELQVTPC